MLLAALLLSLSAQAESWCASPLYVHEWGVQVFLPSEKECWPLVGHVRFAVRPDAEHPKAARRVVADI